MGISEKKMKIVINNYFKQECDVNTSIREAFEKGFRIGVKKGLSAQPDIIYCKECKFYSPMNRETKTGICNLTMHQNFGDNWFCAGAERRTHEL